MKRRAVFFDVGETLVERPTIGPGRRLAEALGLRSDAARTITRLIFRTVFDSPAALAARLRAELALAEDPTAAVAEIWNAHSSEPVEIAGASSCVAAIAAAGARIGVISNIWGPYAAGFRRACPAIVPLVETWHLSYEHGTTKPDAALFHAGLAALEVAPVDALMVGDSLEKDIVPALALGMGAVWLRRDPPRDPGELGVVAVEPDRGAPPDPAADAAPEGAQVARNLADVRRMALTWLWAGRALGRSLTVPLPAERSPA